MDTTHTIEDAFAIEDRERCTTLNGHDLTRCIDEHTDVLYQLTPYLQALDHITDEKLQSDRHDTVLDYTLDVYSEMLQINTSERALLMALTHTMDYLGHTTEGLDDAVEPSDGTIDMTTSFIDEWCGTPRSGEASVRLICDDIADGLVDDMVFASQHWGQLYRLGHTPNTGGHDRVAATDIALANPGRGTLMRMQDLTKAIHRTRDGDTAWSPEHAMQVVRKAINITNEVDASTVFTEQGRTLLNDREVEKTINTAKRRRYGEVMAERSEP